MTSDFAKKVYPTILNVIDVLDRVNNVRGQAPSIDSVRVSLKGDLSHLAGSKSMEEQLSHKALVYYIDELMTESRWGDYWKNNLMEYEVFGTRNRAEAFFKEADQASALGRPDTLETFYLCAALGFQGIYRGGRAGGAASPISATPVRSEPPPSGPKPVNLDRTQGGPESTVAINFDEKTIAGQGGRGPSGPPILEASKQVMVNQGPRPVAPSSKETPFASGQSAPRGGLGEWAQRVYERLKPKAAEKFQPSWAPESAGDCRPLRGRKFLNRAFVGVFCLGLLALVLVGAQSLN